MSRQQVHNASVAQDVGRANLLVNGGMEQWQRGAGPFTAQNAFNADRWQVNIGSGSSCSTTRQISGAGPGGAVTYAVQMNYTHAATTVLFQDIKINNSEFMALLGQTVSLSMRVYASVPNAVQINVATDASANGISSAFHPGNNTWVTLTVPGLVISPSATFLRVQLIMQATGLFYADNAMLVVGAQPCDFVPMHPADDIARCLRYYEVMIFGVNASTQWGVGVGYNTTLVLGQAVFYKVRKVGSPVITSGTMIVSPGAGTQLTGTAQLVNGDKDSAGIQITFGGSISNGAAYVLIQNASNNGGWAIETNP